MTEQDRTHWNDRYRAGEHSAAEPSGLLTALAPYLPQSGAAIDVAGGTGRNAIWLARRGLDVTLADISDVALEVARQRAQDAGLNLQTLQLDLEQDPFPKGPWDLILIMHYLWRPLLSEVTRCLNPGGQIVCIQPTMSNLSRHPKPSARFLLQDGELPTLLRDVKVIHYEEGWLAEGRHEAVLVARRE